MNFFRLHRIAFVVGTAVAVAGIFLTMLFVNSQSRQHKQRVEANVLQQLSTLRAAVESELNARIYLTLGLRAFVATNPDLTHEQFAEFAASLMAEGNGIRSITLIEDNVISDVYPMAGNESAIGVRLLEIPEQRADVERAISSGQPWLSTPIKLVQGGEAFINRAPVFESPSGEPPGSGRYWGLVSILISKDVLMRDIVSTLQGDIRIGIRGRTSNGQGTDYFYGDSSIESLQPMTLHVDLPTGDWEVAAVPLSGWPSRGPSANGLQAGGFVISMVLGVLTFMLLKSNRDYGLARTAAEDAVVQLSRKNEDLEAFIRMASHDLRSPLRHITAFSGFVIEDSVDLSDQSRGHLLRIQESAKRMMQLLSSLLRFAQTGTTSLKREVFSLMQATEDVVTQLPPDMKPHLEFADLPDVFGDRPLITQVLQNLIENGLKYFVGDAPHVRIGSSISGNEVTVSVSDNGIGIQPDQLSRIFQPGVRCVIASDFDGSGFGLAICDRIVKAHGGKMWAESEPDKGSTFYFTLPRKSALSSTEWT